MEVYSFGELLDEEFGKVGTPERDKFDKDVAAEVQAYNIGEAIRLARKECNLTQEQLGERMGVQRAQVSKIESGKDVKMSTFIKAIKAMGLQANLVFGGVTLTLG